MVKKMATIIRKDKAISSAGNVRNDCHWTDVEPTVIYIS